MIPFLKMHGLGNDFVVLDARMQALPPLNWAKLSHRRFGIGCDQVVILESPTLTLPLKGEGKEKADVRMRIINADGSEVDSCGNASRCVGWLLSAEKKTNNVKIETGVGVIVAQVSGDSITVDMGAPLLAWEQIPLARPMDTLHLPITHGVLGDPVAVSMGNPHMVFFVDKVDTVALETLGPVLEHHALFPVRTNVEIAEMVTRDVIKLRVWERGAGLTLACGTGACATLVAAVRRGLSARKAQVQLPGGVLLIEWDERSGHVLMTGEAARSFAGSFAPDLYRS